MADQLATLGIKVTSDDINKAIRRLDKLETQAHKTEKSTGMMSAGFKSLAGTLAGVISATAAVTKLLEVGRSFDVINSSLITVTGSAENAAIAFAGIEEFAAKTPYDLEQVANAFVKMKALGLDPSEAALTSYGNTASAMGKSLNQMVEAVADAATGEFERLKEFGIKARSEGDNVSFTFQGVTTTVKKNAAEIEGYLKRIGNVEFAGAMEERAKTLDGALSNLGDSWDGMFRTMMQSQLGDAFRDAASGASDFFSEITKGMKAAQGDALSAAELKVQEFTAKYEDIQQQLFDRQTSLVSEAWQSLTGTSKGELESLSRSYMDSINLWQEQVDSLKAKTKDAASEISAPTIKAGKVDGGLTDADLTTQEEMQTQSIISAYEYFAALEEAGLLHSENEEQRIINQYDVELTKLMDHQQALIDAGWTRVEAEAEIKDALEALEMEHLSKIELARERTRQADIRSGKEALKWEEMTSKQKVSVVQGGLSQISGMMNSENRKAFEMGKAAATANAVIDTYRAATGAYAAMAGIPVVGPALGAAAAAAAVVAGMANVQSIQSASFGGGGGGRGAVPASVTAPAGAVGGGNIPSAPTPSSESQAPINNYYINGQVGSIDELTGNFIIPAVQDQLNNGSVVLFDNQSAQAQVING